MSTHSSLSPSSAERWIACPGSIQLTAGLKSKSSPAAAQGTVTHTLSEQLVTGQVSEAELRKSIGIKMKTWDGFEVPITKEMVDAAVLYRDTIKVLRDEFTERGTIIAKPEVKVTALSIDPEVKGTADYVIYQVGKRLVVVDLKYGKKAVNPTENKQLGIYLVGVMDSLAKTDDFDELELIVVQPRAGGKAVRRWVVPIEWVNQFRREMKKAVAETRVKNPRLSAGNWCFFCPAKGEKKKDGTLLCPEIARELQSQTMADFEGVPVGGGGLLDVGSLAADKIAKILSWKSVISSWFEDVEQRAKEMREVGLDIPGFKLVEGRKHKKWGTNVTVEKVADELSLYLTKEQLLEDPALKSVSQVEEILGKSGILEKMGLVTRPKGELVIVPLDDGRGEVRVNEGTAEIDFQGVETGMGNELDELLGITVAAGKKVAKKLGVAPITTPLTEKQSDILGDLLGKWEDFEERCDACHDLNDVTHHSCGTGKTIACSTDEVERADSSSILEDLMEPKPKRLWPL